MIIAWDIETCPTPVAEMTDAQKRRLEKLVKREVQRHPEKTEEEASLLVRSINPYLGWIVCISVVRTNKDLEIQTPKSYAMGLKSREENLLDWFWSDMKKVHGHVTWLTFNGKRFDVPFLRTRTLANSLRPSRLDILDTYPWRQHPHCDLFNLFDGLGLADVCDLLGVASPKGDLDGSKVHEAIRTGELDRVTKYCEADVVALLQCYLHAECVIQ